MDKRTIKTGLSWIVVIGVLLLFSWASVHDQNRFRVISSEAVGETTISAKGGRLRIRYKSENARTCPTDVGVTINRIEGELSLTTVWRNREVATQVGDDRTVEVNIPPLPPGAYNYVSTFHATCGDRIYSAAAPPVRFNVR